MLVGVSVGVSKHSVVVVMGVSAMYVCVAVDVPISV